MNDIRKIQRYPIKVLLSAMTISLALSVFGAANAALSNEDADEIIIRIYTLLADCQTYIDIDRYDAAKVECDKARVVILQYKGQFLAGSDHDSDHKEYDERCNEYLRYIAQNIGGGIGGRSSGPTGPGGSGPGITMAAMAMKPLPVEPPKPLLVYFATDSWTVDETARIKLKALAENLAQLNQNNGNTGSQGTVKDDTFTGALRIIGHADAKGSRAYNEGLARARAAQVKSILVESGVPNSMISVDARGEDDPAKPTADGTSDAENRRVIIEFSDALNVNGLSKNVDNILNMKAPLAASGRALNPT